MLEKKPIIKKVLVVLAMLLGVVGILAVALLVFVYTYNRNPIFHKKPIREPSVIDVSLDIPLSMMDVPLNSHVLITASARSRYPLASLELIINDQLYENRSLLDASIPTDVTEYWDWQPGAIGDFYLIVRATDIFGASNFSEVYALRATEALAMVSLYESEEGDTLESIAEEHQVSQEELSGANPDIPPGDHLPSGIHVFIPNQTPDEVTNPNIIPGLQTGIELISGLRNQLPELVSVPEADTTQEVPFPSPELESLGVPQTSWQDWIEKLIGTGALPPQNEEADNQEPQESPENTADEANPPAGDKPGLADAVDKAVENLGNIVDDLSGIQPTNPPPPSILKVSLSGCDAVLSFEAGGYEYGFDDNIQRDSASSYYYGTFEEGFILYREIDKNIEELARFPKVVNWDTYPHKTYVDNTAGWGWANYYLVAYNELGNSTSVATAAFSLYGCDQKPPEPTNTRIDGRGYLKLPPGMDLAYLYVQIDQGDGTLEEAKRVPEGNRFFLANSGQELNIRSYMETLIKDYQEPDMTLHLDVWGWMGGKLVHAGNLKYELNRLILLICSERGEKACSEGNGEWGFEIKDLISAGSAKLEDGRIVILNESDLAEYVYEFKVIPSKRGNLGWFYVVMAVDEPWTRSPNSGTGDYHKYNSSSFLADEGQTKKQHEPFTFSIPLNYTLFSPSVNKDEDNIPELSIESAPGDNGILDSYYKFSLYTMLKAAYGYLGDSYSNQVALHSGQAMGLPEDLPILQSEALSAFDIQIEPSSYQSPNFPDYNLWGCVEIVSDPTGKYQPGDVVCPKDLKAAEEERCGWAGSKCLAEGLEEVMVEVWDEVAWWYDFIKTLIVKGIVKILPFSCKDTCQGRIRTALDYTIAYFTGLPPKLPDSETFYAESGSALFFNIVAELEKGATGSSESLISEICGEGSKCREEVKEFIGEEIKKAENRRNQPACFDTNGKMREDQKFYCLDPSIDVKPIPGSMYAPGVIKLIITRKSDPVTSAYTQEELEAYHQLQIVMKPLVQESEYDVTFKTLFTKFPQLTPGQTVEIYFPLEPIYKDRSWEPFSKRYFGQVSEMVVGEYCLSPTSDNKTVWIPCTEGNTETHQFQNPNSIYEAVP